ncbi:MAG: MFS transporter [Acidimicrobiia bacterium]|jgi:hypothetical protein
MTDILDRLYSTLVDSDDEHGRGDLPEEACREVPGNAAKLVGGFTLQKSGDRVADAKTVLAWMLTSLGAPDFTTALLVPIRESGSLLPQALLVPLVRRRGLRSRVWSAGAVGQSVAIAAIGFAGFTLSGLGLGLATLAGLAIFALARAVSSISAKDVIGKTIPFGDRGSVTGIAASIAGLAAIVTGVVITTSLRSADATTLALVVGGSAVLWLGGAAVFLTVEEEPSPEDASDPATSLRESFTLLAEDAPFRRFVTARALMLVTALSPPFVVALSASVGESAVSGVGPFVVATGIAGLIASPIWGRLADRSSRLVMATASAASALIILAYLGLRQGGVESTWWLGPGTYLLLAIAHAGARMGRKTYVVDMAGGDKRTRYVAVSNTLIGLILLGTGVAGAAVAGFGAAWTLAGLAVAGLAGTGVSLSMEEIHAEEGS